MLACAAMGLPNDEAGNPGAEMREFLQRAADSMAGLAEGCAVTMKDKGSAPAEKYQTFLTELDRDARDFLAAIELVSVQPSIGSELVDNV
jgi:hypothetical protein